MTEKRVRMSSLMGNMMIAGACMAKEDLEENYLISKGVVVYDFSPLKSCL
jgi:hypothetical protein